MTIGNPPLQPEVWQIQMMYSGKKLDSNAWPTTTHNTIRTSMGSPGTAAFMTMTKETSGAGGRQNIDNGQGLYSAFFDQTNITKIAFVDGSSSSLDPTAHNNYLIYDLIGSTGGESINDILKRLDIYQRDAPNFHGNDSVWGDSSVVNHTAGTNGYSGLLVDSGGTQFKAYRRNFTELGFPDRFCIMGINRDSDNDIQALCAFWGNLNLGKGDAWRGGNPEETFWSYWGDDFHSISQTQRIGNRLQTAPGVATQCQWTGDVYVMSY